MKNSLPAVMKRIVAVFLIVSMGLSLLGAASEGEFSQKVEVQTLAEQSGGEMQSNTAEEQPIQDAELALPREGKQEPTPQEEALPTEGQQKPTPQEEALPTEGKQEPTPQEEALPTEGQQEPTSQEEGTADVEGETPLASQTPPEEITAGNASKPEASKEETVPPSEPQQALSWCWVYAAPERADVLSQEEETEPYLMVPENTPREELLQALPQAVEFRLLDGKSLLRSITDWESEYPADGAPAGEQTARFRFIPVLDAEPPQLPEGVPTPAVTVQIAKAEAPQALPEPKPTTENRQVRFYVFIDNNYKELQDQPVPVYRFQADDRWYLSAETLESVYGAYGFQKSMLKAGTYYFPHAKKSSFPYFNYKIWIAGSKEGYSPVLTENAAVDVYYFPKQSLTDGSRGYDYKDYMNPGSQYDGFYSVTIADPHNLAETPIAKEPTYHVSGQDAVIQLPKTVFPVTWTLSGKDGESPQSLTPNNQGQVTIPNISAPYTLTADPQMGENQMLICYDTNVTYPPLNPEFATPKIEGKDRHQVLTEGDHTVLPALPSYYFSYTEAGQKYLAKVSFLAWKVDENTSYQPGQTVPFTAGGIIELKAQWKVERASSNENEKNGSMVNFFVSLTPQIEGETHWTATGDEAGYTDSIYTADCGVQVAPDFPSKQTLLGGDSTGTKTLDQCNAEVMQLQDGWTYQGNPQHHFQVDFPSDEEVLAHIRSLPQDKLNKIKINGQTLSPQDFNSSNFTIKWSKFSSSGTGDGGDGWHIDGILTLKTSKMVVKKRFSGERTPIEAVKTSGNFQIQVTSPSPVHGAVTLTLNGNGGTQSPVGYDAAIDEYTWVVPVDPMYPYTLQESGHTYESAGEDAYLTHARYQVTNSRKSQENTDWQAVPEGGITVTAKGTSQGENHLMVKLDNNYTKPETLTLRKLDGFSKNPMANVIFTVEHQDSEGKNTDYGSLRTDANGYIFLRHAKPGTYTFQEQVPRGYRDPGDITVVVEGTDTSGMKIQSVTSENTGPQGLPFTQWQQGSMEFTVLNHSAYFVPVEVQKHWGNNTRKQDVTLQLELFGRRLGSQYKATLTGEEDQWKHTWTDLPVYVNLPVVVDWVPAKYSIHESQIGNMAYSPDYDSGYRYYEVTKEPMRYLLKNGTRTAEIPQNPGQIEKIVLELTNTQRTGSAAIHKTDTRGYPVEGAHFQLYSIPDSHRDTAGTLSPNQVQAVPDGSGGFTLQGLNSAEDPVPISTAVSDAQGFVNFGDKLPVGEYYLIESKTPKGYVQNSNLYLLDFDSLATFLYRFQDGTQIRIGSNTIKNQAVYVNLIVHNVVEGNQADMRKKFQFDLNSNRPILKTGNVPAEENKQWSFSLGNNETTEEFQVQSGAVVKLNQMDGWDYDTRYTVTVIDPQNQEGTPLPGTGKQFLNGAIDRLEAGSTIRVEVVNRKDGAPDTAVTLDSLPYLLLLAMAGIGFAGTLLRRRRRME